MYWLVPDEKPTENYVNLKAVIDRTNLKIEAFNLEHGNRSAPKKINLVGERGRNHKRTYNLKAFTEQEITEKFELSTASKLSIARMIVKYFKSATPRSIQFLF